MKKIGIMLSAAAALMMAGCAKDMTETPEVGAVGTLYATVEGSDNTTRVGFDQNGKFYWSEGDYIGVNTDQSSGKFKGLGIVSGAGSGNASFSGEVEGQIAGYAVYPHSESHSVSGSILTYTFPSNYTYSKIDTDFFSAEQGYGNSFNAPMWGKIDGNSVQFMHLGGVFCVKIDKMPSASGTFTFSADQKINGTYDANLSNSEPAFTAVNASDGDGTVTITFEGATVGESGVFYVPVPTGDYTNVTVSVGGMSIPCGNFQIDRAMLKALYPKVDAGGTTTVSVDNVNTTISETTPAVTVSGTVQSDATITIPSVSTPVSVSFAQIPTAALTFTEGSGAGSPSASELVVAIPYDETAETLPKPNVTINMPNTTVTLAATAGKAVYGTVTATTADNTLIIDSGVTVGEVIVKHGNVRVKSGATLNNLDASNVVEVYLYAEAGANLPETLAKNVTLVDATLADLKDAAANGGEYVLQSDMAFTEPLVVKDTMTLDLNGHSITAEGETLNKVLNTSDALVLVRRGAKLTINDSSNGKGSIVAGEKPSIYAAVKLTDTNDGASGDAATLVVNGGVLKGYYYGIAGNGTRHNTTININGGEIGSVVNGLAIYHPQNGYITVKGGTLSSDTGIEMRAGHLVVNGGKIVGSGDPFAEEGNPSGSTINGAAVAVSQHSTDLGLSVEVFGGELSGEYALYEKDLQNDTARDKISLKVAGGKFNGGVYSDNCENFVSGGTFSDPSVLAYTTDDADITVSLNADMELSATAVVAKGSATIDLNGYTLTAAANKVIEVSDGAKVTVKNGNVGDSAKALGYGVYANGTAVVTLENVNFSEMVTYAYNGKGTLNATGCTFHGWLSAWHYGGTFKDCIFTIGKKWYPAAICYGSTTFTNCGFFRNGTDADVYDDSGETDADGYYRCNYVVAGCNPTTTIKFNSCYFIDENLQKTVAVTPTEHPYHSCGWGDGNVADANITVDDIDIVAECTDASKSDATEE